ncbi:MAG TPA: hypothetical protein VLA69_05980, partial [Gaiellaceae bacterium]|nr:hypothetical protein [Gaiellaceae bacterium]
GAGDVPAPIRSPGRTLVGAKRRPDVALGRQEAKAASSRSPYVLRKVVTQTRVISFGFFDGTDDELEALRPSADTEEARSAAMAPYVENQFADGRLRGRRGPRGLTAGRR